MQRRLFRGGWYAAEWRLVRHLAATMSKIDMRHAHSYPCRKPARRSRRWRLGHFQVDYGWEGDTLNFTRSGIDGHIELQAQALHVHANWGFWHVQRPDRV